MKVEFFAAAPLAPPEIRIQSCSSEIPTRIKDETARSGRPVICSGVRFTGDSFPDTTGSVAGQAHLDHVGKRLEDRGFTEVDLRQMREHAARFRPDVVDGRFVIEPRFRGRPWEVVVEPDEVEHLLVVVTAFGVGP